MTQCMWEILVPRKSNEGKPFRLRHHRVWDDKVKKVTGGLTVLVPTVKGMWTSEEGEVFIDSTIPVRISCTRDQIEEIMDFTAKHYRQLAVMAYKVSSEVLVKNYEC